MRRNIIYLSHTLYLKAMIPLIEGLIKNGEKVILRKNRPNFLGYSPEQYIENPTANKCINKSSFVYVSGLIHMEDDIKKIIDKIEFSFLVNPKKGDRVFVTTKNIKFLGPYINKGIECYAIGYQHIPLMLKFGEADQDFVGPDICKKVFTEENDFSNYHKFSNVYELEPVKKLVQSNFLNLKRTCEIYQDLNEEKDHVIIFHPGGYRNILTKKGDSLEKSYEEQKKFIERTCLPLLKNNLIPVIKTHPLYARFHSGKDIKLILGKLIEENSLYQNVVVEESDYWPFLWRSKFVLSFGSSSLYELFSAGYKNVYICNFLGEERADKFKMFQSLYLDTYEDYLESIQKSEIKLDDLSSTIFSAYSAVNPSKSVDIVLENL